MIDQFIEKLDDNWSVRARRVCLFSLGITLLLLTSCSELKEPKTEKFYADSKPPKTQVFRWSNGQTPKSFDPAQASAPPETDIVRAIYDGLTETETKTLKAIPSIAYKWSSSENDKIWTFKMRQDAKWSNGEKITASDFVRSWKRLSDMGEKVSHHELLKNIIGMAAVEEETPQVKKKQKLDIFSLVNPAGKLNEKENLETKSSPEKNKSVSEKESETEQDNNVLVRDVKKQPDVGIKKVEKTKEFGVKALDKYTLQVALIKPDKSFPALVAHPIFRPVYAGGKEFESSKLNADIVTSGAFRVTSVGNDGITLDRADYYYNKENIKLDRVQFVPSKDAESALNAYKNGDVDAVTNAHFEPLALKLLTPYVDFQKRTHSALNFYEFNRKNEPFNDRRVRQALSISIDRKSLTENEMEGTSKPAFNYMPFKEANNEEITVDLEKDIKKAKELLKTAGYDNGNGFPMIRLVINRNNIQQKIAKSVKKMWKQNLNIETEIIVREFEEIENSKVTGDFDLIRRGVVLPTSDETANMLAIFSPKKTPKVELKDTEEKQSELVGKGINLNVNANVNSIDSVKPNRNTSLNANISDANVTSSEELKIDTGEDAEAILTEEEAVLEVPAIPLYFPTSYSLVKPYVQGFEINTLDAPLLKDVRINSDWQPEKTDDES